MTRTRFKHVGFERWGKAWGLFDLSGDRPAHIGHWYATRSELLADLDNQAKLRGWELIP